MAADISCQEYPAYCEVVRRRCFANGSPSNEVPSVRMMVVENETNEVVGIVGQASQAALAFKTRFAYDPAAMPSPPWPPPFRKSKVDIRSFLLGAAVVPDEWTIWWKQLLRQLTARFSAPRSPYISVASAICPFPLVWSESYQRCLPPNSSLLKQTPIFLPPIVPVIQPAIAAQGLIQSIANAANVVVANVAANVAAAVVAPPAAPDAPDAPEAPLAPDLEEEEEKKELPPKDCFDTPILRPLIAQKTPWPKWPPLAKDEFRRCVLLLFRTAQEVTGQGIEPHRENQMKQYNLAIEQIKSKLLQRRQTYEVELKKSLRSDNPAQHTKTMEAYNLLEAYIKISKIELAELAQTLPEKLSALPICSYVKASTSFGPLSARQQTIPKDPFQIASCPFNADQKNIILSPNGKVIRCCDKTELQLYPPEPFPDQKGLSPQSDFVGCEAVPSVLFRPIFDRSGKTLLVADMECDACLTIAGDSSGAPIYRRVGNSCLRRDLAEQIGAYFQGAAPPKPVKTPWSIGGTNFTIDVTDVYALPVIEKAFAEALVEYSKRLPVFLSRVEEAKVPPTQLAAISRAANNFLSSRIKCIDQRNDFDPISLSCQPNPAKPHNPNPADVLFGQRPAIVPSVAVPISRDPFDKYLIWRGRPKDQKGDIGFEGLPEAKNVRTAAIEQGPGLKRQREEAKALIAEGERLAPPDLQPLLAEPIPPPPLPQSQIGGQRGPRVRLGGVGGLNECLSNADSCPTISSLATCNQARKHAAVDPCVGGIDYPYILLNSVGLIEAFVKIDGSLLLLRTPQPVPDNGVPAASILGIKFNGQLLKQQRAKLGLRTSIVADDGQFLLNELEKVPNCLAPFCGVMEAYDPVTEKCFSQPKPTNSTARGAGDGANIKLIDSINQRLKSPVPSTIQIKPPNQQQRIMPNVRRSNVISPSGTSAAPDEIWTFITPPHFYGR